MQLIRGKDIAEKVLAECRQDIAELAKQGLKPGLAVILVGDDPASRAYVRSKDRTCQSLGLHSVKLELSADTTQEELLAEVEKLNADPKIHGILVQSPPPPQIDEAAIVRAIDPMKDVDGFHPINVAKLALEDPTGFVPCTPLGCQRLLMEAGAETEADRREIEKRHCRQFTYPAIRILSDWRADGTAPATPETAIPKRIVQYWNETAIPEEIAAVMANWERLPGYHYTRHDRRSAIGYLAERFGKQVVRAFSLANHPTEESDFLRLCVLWDEGGIYADADDMVVGDLDALLARGGGAILFQEQFGAIANNVICARPGHPLIKTALNMACAALIARANDGTWTKTGPGLLTRAAAVYVTRTPEAEARRDLLIVPQYQLHRHVHPHLKLSYKATPRYWNAADGAVPTLIRDVLSQIVA